MNMAVKPNMPGCTGISMCGRRAAASSVQKPRAHSSLWVNSSQISSRGLNETCENSIASDCSLKCPAEFGMLVCECFVIARVLPRELLHGGTSRLRAGTQESIAVGIYTTS